MDLWAAGCVLFALLCGYQPFYAPIVTSLIELIKRGEYEFSGSIWRSVSANAKDLVSSLLQCDPAKRPSVHQALAHPWFNSSEVQTKRRFSGTEFRKNLLRNQRRLTRRKISDNPQVLGSSDAKNFSRGCRFSLHLTNTTFEDFF